MKLVWKCEYKNCSEYHERKSDAIKHKKKCSQNPANKQCSTCKHRGYDYDALVGWYCTLELLLGNSNCELWEWKGE